MANRSISIDVEPRVSGSTAKLCAAALEIYLNQNPELELKVQKLDDGTMTVRFKEAKSVGRRFVSSDCVGLGNPGCERCDMPCPYR